MPKLKKQAAVASKAPYSTSKKTNSEDSSDTAESQNSESLCCGVCTTDVDYLIQCKRCDTWYCHTCAKVPEQLIELLVDCNEAHWFCHNCNPIAVEAICNLSSDSNSNGAVFDLIYNLIYNLPSSSRQRPFFPTVSSEACKTVVESITTAIKHLDEVVLDTKKQLYEFAKAFQVESVKEGNTTDMFKVSSDVPDANITVNPPQSGVDDLTHSLIAEQRERDKRNSQSRKQDDITSLNSIFAKYLNITPTIINAIRLGKKDSDKPRIMKITLSSLEEKSLVLQNKYKLKNEKNPDSIKKI